MQKGSENPASAVSEERLEIAARVDATPLEERPCIHVYLEEVFPPAYYRRLLDHLPETRRYRELTHRDAMQANGHSARRKFYLLPEHIALLPVEQRVFWKDLSRVLSPVDAAGRLLVARECAGR